MGISRVILSCASLLTASILAVGCAAPTGDGAGEDALGQEEVGAAQEAFGEASCTTAYANVVNHTEWHSGVTSPYYSATSYGQPSCTNAFVVDYMNGTQLDVPVWAGFYEQPDSQGACSIAHVRVKTYEQINGAWVPADETRLHGAWRGGECWFDADSGYPALVGIGTRPTRVAAQAYSTMCLLGRCSTTIQPVKINAYVSIN